MVYIVDLSVVSLLYFFLNISTLHLYCKACVTGIELTIHCKCSIRVSLCAVASCKCVIYLMVLCVLCY